MNLSEKRILIVGANGSMAKKTIEQLIKDGARNIVMACRTKPKGEEAKQEILDAVGTVVAIDLEVVGGFDMNDPNKIATAVGHLTQDPFHIVFLAAGFAVFSEDYEAVEWKNQQIEKTVFQNMMGSHLTLMRLKKNNLLAKNARVLLAGGEGARGIKGMIAKPEFRDAQALRDYIFLKEKPAYNPMNAIGVSKLVGALWTKKIATTE